MRTELAAVVTGAGRGLGRALLEEYVSRGDRVLGVVRDPSQADALRELGSLAVPVVGDIRDASTHRAIADLLGDGSLDVLIHNAGVQGPLDRAGQVDVDSLRASLEIFAVAPLLLTSALLPALRRASRPTVVFIGSRWADAERPSGLAGGGFYAYRIGKAAGEMAGRVLADDLATEQIEVHLFRPPAMSTRMGGPDAVETPGRVASRLFQALAHAGRGRSFRLVDNPGD